MKLGSFSTQIYTPACLNPAGADAGVVGGLRFSDGAYTQHPVNLLKHEASSECPGGMQLFGTTSNDLHDITHDGQTVGWWYDTAYARVAWLWGVTGDCIQQTRLKQSLSMFQQAAEILQQAGLGWSDVVRTWIYLDELLQWYGEFNRVRTQFFDASGVLNGLVPASTGIGIGNLAGAACCMGLVAVRPHDRRMSIQSVGSPLQGSALDYRSSFSRAVEISTPDARQVMISGTASIAPNGDTLHKGDAAKQIELSMQVVEAILKSRDMSWDNTTRMIAYHKSPEYVADFMNYCAAAGIGLDHCLFVHADICRDDLLFELELDAQVTTP